MSYRVTGTLRPGGKQQKEVFGTLEAAEACRDAWECIRVSNHAALRARATPLSQAELTPAEPSLTFLRFATHPIRLPRQLTNTDS